jgi:hypothetical protein
MTPAEIEQVKHTASWLNSLATAVAAGGAIAPLFAFITGTLPGTASLASLTGVGLVCTLLAMILHLIGREILAEI